MADSDGFADAVTVALAVERRVAKRSETVNDLRRYHRASELVERVARSTPAPVNLPDLVIAANDLIAMPGLTDVPADRTGASFHPPDSLAELDAALAMSPVTAAPKIRAYLHAAIATGAGVVVISEPLDPAAPSGHAPVAMTRSARSSGDPDLASAYGAAARTGESCFTDIPRRLKALAMLRDQIEASLLSGQPVPVGSQARHDVLAEGLREFAALPRGELRLIYVDGSEPAPFAAGLTPTAAAALDAQMRLGLLSMRHAERDADVDAYWFRNRLVSTSDRTFAETDAYCARETVAQLTALSARGIRAFELVHTTGHECAAIGFYRGLSQWLAAGGSMAVQPRYMGYAGADLTGTTWAR
jgi:hypothetical protein